MHAYRILLLLTVCVAMSLSAASVATAVDTDGDGLLDLMDLDGADCRFDPHISGTAAFEECGIQDLDGASELSNVQELDVFGNQITSIESGDFDGLNNLEYLFLSDNQIASIETGAFDGLNNLESLVLRRNRITSIEQGDFDGLTQLEVLALSDNQITSIESGAFADLTNLRTFWLRDNQLTELNFTRAKFISLWGCDPPFLGFCVLSDEITSLTLDDATLNMESFDAIALQTPFITDASLIGLRFADEKPGDLTLLLDITTLGNVTIDQALFDTYADELNAFAATEGNTLTVIGYGESNLDGEFNSRA